MMKSHIIKCFVMNNEPDINLRLNNDKRFMQNNICQIKNSLYNDQLFVSQWHIRKSAHRLVHVKFHF